MSVFLFLGDYSTLSLNQLLDCFPFVVLNISEQLTAILVSYIATCMKGAQPKKKKEKEEVECM